MTPAQLAARLETVKRLHERGEIERAADLLNDTANRMIGMGSVAGQVTLSPEEYRHVC